MENSKLPVAFSTFIMGLTSAALIELGLIEDPQTKQKRVNRDHARSHIDLLTMLQEKTKGNLSADEKILLDQALTDLRLHFARIPS